MQIPLYNTNNNNFKIKCVIKELSYFQKIIVCFFVSKNNLINIYGKTMKNLNGLENDFSFINRIKLLNYRDILLFFSQLLLNFILLYYVIKYNNIKTDILNIKYCSNYKGELFINGYELFCNLPHNYKIDNEIYKNLILSPIELRNWNNREIKNITIEDIKNGYISTELFKYNEIKNISLFDMINFFKNNILFNDIKCMALSEFGISLNAIILFKEDTEIIFNVNIDTTYFSDENFEYTFYHYTLDNNYKNIFDNIEYFENWVKPKLHNKKYLLREYRPNKLILNYFDIFQKINISETVSDKYLSWCLLQADELNKGIFY